MKVKDFIDMINELLKDKQMQVIPANFGKKFPKYPFVTYEVIDGESDPVMNDRIIREEKLIDSFTFRDEADIQFRVYSSSPDEVMEEKDKLFRIIYINSNKFMKAGFGIINHVQRGSLTEDVEKKKVHSMIFDLTIDYNNTEERIIQQLEGIEIKGDIEKNLNLKEGE